MLFIMHSVSIYTTPELWFLDLLRKYLFIIYLYINFNNGITLLIHYILIVFKFNHYTNNLCIKLSIIILSNVYDLLLELNNLSKFFYKNNNFIKEGFYLDLLQKLSYDVWLKNFIYVSTQVFNLNFLNNYIIKFIINSILNYITNTIITTDNINLYQILLNVLIMFLICWHFFYIILINIYILS